MEPLCKGDRQRVLVDGAVQASITLGAVVQPSFGPNGLDVLLESSDGFVSCCNCGYQILASLSLSHPVGALISKSVTDYHHTTGDGSKKMLLVLKGALEEFSSSLDPNQLQHSKTEVSQAIAWLNHTVIPGLTASLGEKKILCKAVQTPEELHCTLIQVASSSYRHKYGSKISRKLGEILSTILLPPNLSHDFQSMKKHVQFTRKNMSTLLVPLPGHPVSHSRSIPGFVLDRDLVHPMERWELQGVQRLRSVFVLDWSDPDYGTSHPPQLSVDLLSDLEEIVDTFSQHTADTVHALQATDVQLVLCSGKASLTARQQLREAGIMIVEMIAEDMLRVLAECCATYPLDTLHDLGDPGTAVVDLTLSPLDVDSKQYLCLQLPRDMKLCPVSVVLCAPTTGFCRQLEQQLANTLQVTVALCQDDSDSPAAAVAGGGAWEMAVIRQLEKCIQDQRITNHSPKWTTIKALQKGLMAIPHSLLTASLPALTTRHSTLALYTSSTLTTSESPYMGVDCVNGILTEVDQDWPVWEPYSSQCHLLYSVLSLLTQLLRLDLMVGAKRLKHYLPSTLARGSE